MTTLQNHQQTSSQFRRVGDANRSNAPDCDVSDYLFAEFISAMPLGKKNAFLGERELNPCSNSSIDVNHFPPRAETEIYSHLLRRRQLENLSDKTVRRKPTA